MAARRPFWKRHRWKSIGFCLWPPSTCIWSLKLKFQIQRLMIRKPCRLQTDRRTDGQTDKVNPVYPPPTSLGGGIIIAKIPKVIFLQKKRYLCREVHSRPPVYQIWRFYLDLWGHDCKKWVWPTLGCKLGQSDPIVMQLKLEMSCHLLNV